MYNFNSYVPFNNGDKLSIKAAVVALIDQGVEVLHEWQAHAGDGAWHSAPVKKGRVPVWDDLNIKVQGWSLDDYLYARSKGQA